MGPRFLLVAGLQLPLLFAQVAPSSSAPDGGLSWQLFGAWGISNLILIWIIIDQRKTIQEQAKELREDRKQIVEEVVPLATRMLDALKEAADIVAATARENRRQ